MSGGAHKTGSTRVKSADHAVKTPAKRLEWPTAVRARLRDARDFNLNRSACLTDSYARSKASQGKQEKRSRNH